MQHPIGEVRPSESKLPTNILMNETAVALRCPQPFFVSVSPSNSKEDQHAQSSIWNAEIYPDLVLPDAVALWHRRHALRPARLGLSANRAGHHDHATRFLLL